MKKYIVMKTIKERNNYKHILILLWYNVFMKSGQVLKRLRITRPTLTRYVKDGKIKVELLPNGQYNYDDNSVYQFLNKDLKTL